MNNPEDILCEEAQPHNQTTMITATRPKVEEMMPNQSQEMPMLQTDVTVVAEKIKKDPKKIVHLY